LASRKECPAPRGIPVSSKTARPARTGDRITHPDSFPDCGVARPRSPKLWCTAFRLRRFRRECPGASLSSLLDIFSRAKTGARGRPRNRVGRGCSSSARRGADSLARWASAGEPDSIRPFQPGASSDSGDAKSKYRWPRSRRQGSARARAAPHRHHRYPLIRSGVLAPSLTVSQNRPSSVPAVNGVPWCPEAAELYNSDGFDARWGVRETLRDSEKNCISAKSFINLSQECRRTPHISPKTLRVVHARRRKS
jgi:hypothetical protein